MQVPDELSIGLLRLPDLLIAAAMSSILLALSHAPLGSDLWALIALSPLLIVIRLGHTTGRLLVASVITALGPVLIMLESVVSVAPASLFAGTLLHTAQIFVPLVAWRNFQTAGSWYRPVAAMVACWQTIELLRSQPLLNNSLASFYSFAYTQSTNSPLITLANVGGTTLVTVALLAANCLIAVMFIRKSAWPVLCICAVVGSSMVLGPNKRQPISEASGTKLNVISVQPAWTPSDYWLLGAEDSLAQERYLELVALLATSSLESDFIALPETIVRSESGLNVLQKHLDSLSASELFTGAVSSDAGSNYNSVIRISDNETEPIYNKWQLVPFYETRLFQAGEFAATLTNTTGLSYGFIICMDGTFEWLVRETIRAGADLLVLISATDYGYGHWTPELQLEIARFHAITFSIPILFVSTNGPTALIDINGDTIAGLAQGVQASIESSIRVSTGAGNAVVDRSSWLMHVIGPCVILSGLFTRGRQLMGPRRRMGTGSN